MTHTSGGSVSAVDWNALDAAITGEVVLPGSSTYDLARMPFIARFDDVAPSAVVRCTRPEDVAETISFVRRHNLQRAVRSGGHCYAGRSSTQGVLIDITPMRSLSISGDAITIGAGARLGDIYEQLLEHGLTIPAGSCPTVGIAGLALGGGFGILGRKHGLTSDHLLGAQVVLADGRVVECDDDRHADLFWALRGAGCGNFGVVTSLVFRPLAAPSVTNLRLTWPAMDAAAVIDAWQHWAPTAPDELAVSVLLRAPSDAAQPPFVELVGAMLGDEAETDELLGELVARAGREPATVFREHMSYRDTRRFWAHLDGGGTVVRHGYRFNKSEFFRRVLPTEAVTALVNRFRRDRVAGQYRELDFSPWGGAYNRVASDATAFAHRDQRFLLKHTAEVHTKAPIADKDAAHRWVTQSWDAVHRFGSGSVYPNFPDPDLDAWDPCYYADNHARLLQIKAVYDPTDFFNSQPDVPPPATE